MKRILIFGKGFFGQRLQEEFGCELTGKRIASLQDAKSQIRKYKPQVIINCIGHRTNNVDECELDKEKTLFSNAFVPVILAEAAVRENVRFVHISSGCIYDFDYRRDKPIKEEAEPDFFGLFYSRTKIYAEQALKSLGKKYPILIVRPRIPLDDRPHARNLLTKLIKYGKVIDLANSVSYVPDFVKALKHLIEKNARGIYNVVNKGALRYQELLEVYRRHEPGFRYKVVSYKELGLVRSNLILSVRKLEKSGFKMRDIHEVLEGCVKKYVQY
jgi:dTDP-4-dehydrorhamnose reductase